MPTMFALSTLAAAVVGVLALTTGIAFLLVNGIQDLRGDLSFLEPSGEATWSPRKPSIERSATNSTASITVQANPARPLAYSVEPVSGSSRLVKLTVLYEQSLGASESAILKSDDFVLKPEEPPLTGVDDPRWIGKVEQKYETRAWNPSSGGSLQGGSTSAGRSPTSS